MVLNVGLRREASAGGLLLWCALGAVVVQVVLWRLAAGNPHGFSPIFWYLLEAFDAHGNVLLAALAAGAYFLRRRPEALALVRFAADRPWQVAAIAFVLLCFGAREVYRAYPLSMDEYAALFQAKVFASGRTAGRFPPELLDDLIPQRLQNYFLIASRASGEISASYWPGFALLLAPFAWAGVPWAANPAIGALTLPALHRLTREITGSREAAGWSVLLAAASPVFVVSSISYYAMPAHLLLNLLYALLLLQPSVARALVAGLAGSLAATLHNPVPHLLFSLPFFVWLIARGRSGAILAALVLGYVPLAALLGFGWSAHLAGLQAAAGAAVPTSAPAPVLLRALEQLAALAQVPGVLEFEARLAGLTKLWTWGAAGLVVLAALGLFAMRALTGATILAAALGLTFAGYFLVRFDQGHGWGYRYLHSAWFVVPLLAAIALEAAARAGDDTLRSMAAWGLALSIVFANGQRLIQVDAFLGRHLGQVPPLARPADPARREIVFVEVSAGFYTHDMVQNDPFLRGPRTVLVRRDRERTARLMASRFPGYVKTDEGAWGERWIEAAAAGSRS